MTSTDSTPANHLSMNWSTIWSWNHKRDTFPCSKGELLLPIQFPKCCVILPPSLGLQIGCTNECTWNYRAWFVGPYFSCSQGGTKGQTKRRQEAGEGLAAEKLSWHADPGVGTLSRLEARVPDWPLRSPGGMQNTWGNDARQIISHPKSQSFVSGETNGSQVSQSELNCSGTQLC